MIDRIFFVALSLCLIVTGALGIGSSLIGTERPAAAAVPVRIVQLAPVVVTTKRLAPTTAVAHTDPGEATAQRVE